MQDEFVGSDGRAETLAEYFAKIRWRIRHDAISLNANALYEELEMDEGAIKTAEVEEAINNFKKKQAPGLDTSPPEFFKALIKRRMGWRL